ncbi:hypothetical protein [Mycolicibacterium lutetiense]
MVPTTDAGVSSAEGVAEEVEANGCADSAVSELLVVASEVSEAAGVTVEGAGDSVWASILARISPTEGVGICKPVVAGGSSETTDTAVGSAATVWGASGDAGSEVSEVLAVPAVLTVSAVSEVFTVSQDVFV